MSTFRHWAIGYARAGIPVFTLAPPEKVPLLSVREGGRGFMTYDTPVPADWSLPVSRCRSCSSTLATRASRPRSPSTGVWIGATCVEKMGAPSERWLIENLRAGRLPGRKIGRHCRMTDEDIVAALDTCANDARHLAADADVIPRRAGLTPRSRKRVVRK